MKDYHYVHVIYFCVCQFLLLLVGGFFCVFFFFFKLQHFSMFIYFIYFLTAVAR